WPVWIVIALSFSVTRTSNPRPGLTDGFGLGLGALPSPALPQAVRTRAAKAAIRAALIMNTQRMGPEPGNTRAVAPVNIGDSRATPHFMAPWPDAGANPRHRMQHRDAHRHRELPIPGPGRPGEWTHRLSRRRGHRRAGPHDGQIGARGTAARRRRLQSLGTGVGAGARSSVPGPV